MIPLTAINAKEIDSKIHDTLYLVSFMNLSAVDAAIIISTIEIIRAMSLTIENVFDTKIGVFL
jgi:hypothetical protein